VLNQKFVDNYLVENVSLNVNLNVNVDVVAVLNYIVKIIHVFLDYCNLRVLVRYSFSYDVQVL
jgi:hypothetical protein